MVVTLNACEVKKFEIWRPRRDEKLAKWRPILKNYISISIKKYYKKLLANTQITKAKLFPIALFNVKFVYVYDRDGIDVT